MCVDHGRLHIAMAEEFLNGSDVVPVFQQVGGKGMPERMAGRALGESGFAHCHLDRLLPKRFVEVVPAALAGLLIDIDPREREDPAPSTFPVAEVTETSSGQVEL